jgi:hypothetical protein
MDLFNLLFAKRYEILVNTVDNASRKYHISLYELKPYTFPDITRNSHSNMAVTTIHIVKFHKKKTRCFFISSFLMISNQTKNTTMEIKDVNSKLPKIKSWPKDRESIPPEINIQRMRADHIQAQHMKTLIKTIFIYLTI